MVPKEALTETLKQFPKIGSYESREVIPDKTGIRTIDCTPQHEKNPRQ